MERANTGLLGGAKPGLSNATGPGGAPAEDPSKVANIQAVIRLRPAKKHEIEYIECNPRVGNVFVAKDLDYTDKFAAILGGNSSQAEAFRVCGMPLVEATLAGRSTCLFAYGQTGSGKTFSMYGAEGGKNPSKLDGLVPGICAELFRRKQELEKRKDFQLVFEATLVEVQGNKVADLLAEPMPDGFQPQLRVVGDQVLGAWVEKVRTPAARAERARERARARARERERARGSPCMASYICRRATHITFCVPLLCPFPCAARRAPHVSYTLTLANGGRCTQAVD